MKGKVLLYECFAVEHHGVESQQKDTYVYLNMDTHTHTETHCLPVHDVIPDKVRKKGLLCLEGVVGITYGSFYLDGSHLGNASSTVTELDMLALPFSGVPLFHQICKHPCFLNISFPSRDVLILEAFLGFFRYPTVFLSAPVYSLECTYVISGKMFPQEDVVEQVSRL